MGKFRAILLEDEPLAREYFRSLLEATDDFEIVAEIADGASALTVLNNIEADVLFVDVQMPGMSGIEVLDRLEDGEVPLLVFVTAFDSYAVEAFERYAVDYLLKPFDESRFTVMLERVRERLRAGETAARNQEMQATIEALRAGPGGDFLKRIPVRTKGKVVLVPTESIDWIEATDYYATIHAEGKNYLLRESLAKLEEQLEPSKFVRIHRKAIVNIERIKEFRALGAGEYQVVAGDGTLLRLSRRRKEALERVLGRPL